MIDDVTFDVTRYQLAPARFEAGTGSLADAVGLGAALDYLQQIGMDRVAAHERELMNYTIDALCRVSGLRLVGKARERAGVVSFVLDGVPSDKVGAALDREGIAVRAGHHCAQPVLRRLGVESTVRPSLALYNNRDDVDALASVLHRMASLK